MYIFCMIILPNCKRIIVCMNSKNGLRQKRKALLSRKPACMKMNY